MNGEAMRVGVIGPIYPDSFADNISRSLPAVGASAFPLGPANPRGRNQLWNRSAALVSRTFPEAARRLQATLVRRARDQDLDAVITVQAALHPETVRAFQRAGIKICLWYPDSVANLLREWVALSPYDALFFKEPVVVRQFSDILGLPVHYLPQSCNPIWHRPPDPLADSSAGDDAGEASGHLVVAGNLYATRARLLSLLLDSGVPLKIYGPPPSKRIRDPRIQAAHAGRYITREDKARVFRSSAAVLNSMHPAEIDGVNLRLFEATACGAAVITEHRAEVPRLFAPDTEVLTFTRFDELIGHAKTLLADRSAGVALGDAATKRAHAEHTYAHRLTRLLEVIT
jgi:spore maturation protein CgeB